MTQLVDKPTRITDESAYILDLILTDSPGYVDNVKVIPPFANLDHNIIYGEFQYKVMKRNKIVREIWHYNNADFIALNNALKSSLDISPLLPDEINSHNRSLVI